MPDRYAYTTIYSGVFNNSPSAKDSEWLRGAGISDEKIKTTTIGNQYSTAGQLLIFEDTLSNTGESVAMQVKYYYIQDSCT